MIKDLVCDHDNTLLEAMHIINGNGMGICFVVDELNFLKGVVTDGDIRRALLNDARLDEEIKNILSEGFVYGSIDDHYDNLISKITHGIDIIPLVDSNFKVVDFFEYKQNIHFPVAIPNLNGNEFKYLTDAFLSSWISSSGKYIDKFESEFSSYSGCSYGVSVSNGTVALHLAMMSLGIGEGDEVIVPNLTFAATINAVLHANAIPVIVDVERDSWCIDPVEIEKAITKKTKALIPVHLYGQPCDMDRIMSIANRYNLKVIEDCAEAHGATYKNKKVGSFGDVGCFSFYGNKIITTGEGGMCVTNNLELDKSMRVMRDHGMNIHKKYWHDVAGYNYRMTNLQAAIGVAQLERIDLIHENRQKYEQLYKGLLSNMGYTFQKDLQDRCRVTWLVCLLLDENTDREEYINRLKEKGIDARPFFYLLSDMDIYKDYCHKDTPIARKISTIGLNLPTYESLKSITKIDNILSDVKR